MLYREQRIQRGFKGRHIWIFLKEPLPSRDAIVFVKRVFASMQPAPPGITREIFPKQSKVAKQALGCMIKLPLGLHKLTNQRCAFFSFDNKVIENQLQFLHDIKQNQTRLLHTAIEQLKLGGEALLTDTNIDTSEVKELLNKCNVLKYLIEKAEKENHLAHIDRMTLLQTIGHLKTPGHYMLHQIMRKTYNYEYRITQRWISRLKGLPVSCPKIREWQSHITPSIGCYCQFPKSVKCYPTPILHVQPEFQPPPRNKCINNSKSENSNESPIKPPPLIQNKPSRKLIDKQDIDPLIEQYIQARKEFREILIRKKDMEEKLEYFFQQNGYEELEVPGGVLRRVKTNEEIRWVIEI